MKAILEFDISDHQEKLEHVRALHGTSAYCAIFAIMNDVFRQRIKYGNLDLDTENLLREMQTEINAILDDNDINLTHLE